MPLHMSDRTFAFVLDTAQQYLMLGERPVRPRCGDRLNLGRGRRRYETNEEAYDLYLRARASMTRLFPGDDEVIGLFEKAIARDSSLAPAYAGLAAAYAWKSFSSAGDPNRDEELQKMQAAAEAAIQLDPLLAE